MKINPKIYHAALIIYLAAIFILSSLPGDDFPNVDFKFSDKIVHAIIYAILFILFFYSLKNQSKYTKLQKFALEYSFLFTALYGITDELHQYFVPKRSSEFADWLADVLGALIIYAFFKMYYSKKKKLAATLFLLTCLGCSSSENTSSQSDGIKVTITQQEAWLDLMPIVDEKKNNFGFIISLDLSPALPGTNYSIKNYRIYLNNDTLLDKTFSIEMLDTNAGVKKINITQLNDEMYLNKDKPMPEEAQFVFSIYKDNKKIKTVKTSKLKINKVY